MTLAIPIATPLYEGGGTSPLVPDQWDCAIGGHTFMLDWKHATTERFSRQSVSLLRPQQDQGSEFTEGSLNPEEFIRRAGGSWHLGAGQVHQDRAEGSPFRFNRSRGIDPWTKWQITLLPQTATYVSIGTTSTLASLNMVSVGDELWVTANSFVWRFTNLLLSPLNTVTGHPGVDPTGLATDGYNVWVSFSGPNGISIGTRGSNVMAGYVTGAAVDCLGYAKGRLMAAVANVVYNITAAGPLPTALFTHSNTDFRWQGFAEGHNVIYAAGFSGDKSYIYRVGIKTDGTALDPLSFVVAGELPDGEVVRSIQGYLGYVCIGTDKGVRFAQPDDSGDLTIGAIIPTDHPVYAFEPQDRFVWYGLTNYDSTRTGLGRLDLTQFTGPLTPAYASDLMAGSDSVPIQGNVAAVATFLGHRVFMVESAGIYVETDSVEENGYVDSGYVYFGIPDDKVAMFLDVRHRELHGSVSASIALNYDTTFALLGTNSVQESTGMVLSAGEARAQSFTVRLALTREAAVPTRSPIVHRWTLEANPAPGRGEFFNVPILLFETVETLAGPKHMETKYLYNSLLGIQALGRAVTYQDITGSYTVFLDDHQFFPEARNASMNFYDGTFIVRLRHPRQRS